MMKTCVWGERKINNKKMEHLKKAPNHRVTRRACPVPRKNRARWEKAAKMTPDLSRGFCLKHL